MTDQARAHEQRELLIDELYELDLEAFTLSQLHRLSKALEKALDDVETELMRRNGLPDT